MQNSEAIAAQIAESLGARISGYLNSGDDAEVWYLSDGRILKLTSSLEDAAACLAIMDAQDSGKHLHPGVARVHEVRRVGVPRDTEDAVFMAHGDTFFAIIRDDVDPAPISKMGEDWEDLLTSLNIASGVDRRTSIDPAMLSDILIKASVYRKKTLFGRLVSTLDWIRQELGIHVTDICPENFGIVRGNAIGPLDYGHAIVPAVFLNRMRHDPALQLNLVEPLLTSSP